MSLILTFIAWGLWQIGLMPLWVPITSTVLVGLGIGYKLYNEK